MFRFLSLISLLAALTAASTIPPHRGPPTQDRGAGRLLGSSFGIPGDNVTYDYIIVGGGNAGLTLATRLAEQQSGTVAVVEAGSFYEISNSNLSQVPATDGAFTGRSLGDWQPLIDWGYATTPQSGAYDVPIHYARGKTLGGSSARNYMAYQRGTEGSYKAWADAVGDDSYTFDNFIPYFEKSIHFTPPDMSLRFRNGTPEYDESVLGDGSGPLSVTFSHYVQVFGTWATRGLEQLGIPIIKGFQSGKLLGQSYSMFTIDAKTMTRDSSETSFLRKGLDLPNYVVHHSTLTKKILFNEDKEATGVLVDTAGFEYILSARKEVILSAGVFGSPQLLMVSGVGPTDELKALDIPVVAHRPGVGQNFQDHIYFGPSWRVNAPTISALQDPAFASQAARDFNERAAGMYTNPVTDVLAWEKVPKPLRSSLSNTTLQALATYPADWPELEYLSLSVYLGFQENSRQGDPNDGFNYASLAIALCTPRSRGKVGISSTDMAVQPIINPNFLVDRADQEVAVAGYKRAREFFDTPAMRKFRIGDDEAFPGLNVTTDEEILDIIKKSYNTIYHGACTCSMGKEGDEKAVVDTQGRVYGVKNLRVVDASIFPLLPPGHPMATVYAIAEKIACDIAGNCHGGHY